MMRIKQSVAFSVLIVFVFSSKLSLFGQSGIFDRTGNIAGHGIYSSVPIERVDMFTGNLTLSFRDIYLPGPNGLDVEIWRVYNSKLLKDRQSGQTASVQANPYSWVGMGWTMHMGMVHQYTSNTPVIEFPDGRREIAFPDNYGVAKHITKDFLKYDKAAYKLYFKSGVIWTFGASATITLADGTSDPVRLVTKIENSYGHNINVVYNSGTPTIDHIVDSMGRQITFVSIGSPRKLINIKVKNYDGTHDVVYICSVGAYSNGYYKLSSFTPPGLSATTFDYYDGSSSHYELTKVTTSYGGVLEYSYLNHDFYFSNTYLDSRVVSQKKITFNPGEDPNIWNYTYPSYQGVTSGVATVQGPLYNSSFTHCAYDSSCLWKIGSELGRTVSDGSYSDTYDWTYQQISDTPWTVLGTSMGTAKGPLVSSTTAVSSGDATLKREFVYGSSWPKQYGLPSRINHYINGSASPKSYKDVTYYFQGHSGFYDRFILSAVDTEADSASDGTLLKKTIMSYFEESGKWGAIKQVNRLKTGTPSTYYTWDYTYTSPNPWDIQISVDAPGSEGVSNTNYWYGVLISANDPGFNRLTRTISSYNSFILTETNQYDGQKSYSYDDLGRITSITLNSPFNAINDSWRPNNENRVVITQGENSVTKYWDGMGRDLGYIESGDNTTLYYRKVLDAEGRVKEENRGSDSPGPTYTYVLDASGRPTQATDPVGKTTNKSSHVSYAGITKTVTDPENHSAVFEFNDFPGSPTKLTDAQNHVATYAYDGAGRLKTVVYNGTRTQSYDYDGVDNVKSETHPETGTTSYTYNTENRLSQKDWGGVSCFYTYNTSGQLVTFTGAEQVTYGYDPRGRLQTITGSSGWSRYWIQYNNWGMVTSEYLTIPGLGTKHLGYHYDNNNNLVQVDYPNQSFYSLATFNGLNTPETLSFNTSTQKPIISGASYGPSKMITALTIQGNGTSYSATYNNNGALSTASLMNGSTSLFNASYTYDGVGNILGISGTAPSPSLSATFGYDSLNRLTSANYTSGRVASFAYDYDEYGNMLTVRENGAVVFSKTYSSSNRINGYSYDGRGNLTSTGTANYFWDAQNRLSAITDAYGQYLADYRYDERGLRFSALLPVPDIEIQSVPTGGSADFTSSLNTPADKTFTLQNLGHASLVLNGLTITGTDASQFTVQQQPASPIAANGSTTFTVRFLPSLAGNKSATLSIASNDPDENPYTIVLNGYCEPEIEVLEAPSGGSYDFGTISMGDFIDQTLTIQNLGTANLILYGAPVVITGPGGASFQVVQQAVSPVLAGGNTTFIVRFAPTSQGLKTATLSIQNNDLNENPYTITLQGTGQKPPQKVSTELAFKVTSPAGGETLVAGSIKNINWTGGGTSKVVRIEYSTDNGSIYKTIVGRAANIGTYPWQVPAELSEECLIRVSDADGTVTAPMVIAYDFNFKISAPNDVVKRAAHFRFRAGLPDQATQSLKVADTSFVPDELKGSENLVFNQAVAELQEYDHFLGAWHHAQIEYDLSTYTGSVWIDGQPILNSIPLSTELKANASPEVSVQGSVDLPVKLWLDDLVIKFRDKSVIPQATEEPVLQTLVKDDFNRYQSTLFPGKGGWLMSRDTVESQDQGALRHVTQYTEGGLRPPAKSALTSRGAAAFVDESEYASRSRSFKFVSGDTGAAYAVKRISFPPRVPFAVSGENFSIANSADDQGGGLTDHGSEASREGRKEGKENPVSSATRGGRAPSGRDSASGQNGQIRTNSNGTNSRNRNPVKAFSASPAGGSYYIHSFDGKLLAEYNISGVCVRDYIYMGNKLIAEYDPPSMQYYYYTSDQINSTRIVTDGSGAVAFAAAHDPYGGIQKAWVSTFNPVLRFSGKERDGESGLDYFGARYYDSSQYRFISTDSNPHSGISDSKRLNLYTFCGGNPVTYIDPDGSSYIVFSRFQQCLFIYSGEGVLVGTYPASNNSATPYENGTYPFNGYTSVPDTTEDWQAIDSLGFFSFPMNGNANYGIHSGRLGWKGFDSSNSWQYPTNGCIRTTQEAMLCLYFLHFIWKDRITDLTVTDEWRLVRADAQKTNSFTKEFEKWLDGMYSVIDLQNDYFMQSGPIPPGALDY